MNRDIFVDMPRAMPVTGDNVLYSTRPFVGQGNGRPLVVGPVQPDERQMNSLGGVFQANQDATLKFQFWDVNSATWVTVNNSGNGDLAPSVGGPATFVFSFPQGGDVQLVANFAIAPTSWKIPAALRLSKN